MRLFDYLTEALRDLRSAKLRTALTSLGIIIGVASVVLLMSMGEGVRTQIAGAFSDLGSTRIMIAPAAPGGGMGMGGPVTSTFTPDDVEALAQVDGVTSVASVISFGGVISGPAGELPTAITGTGVEYFEINGDTFVDGAAMGPDGEMVLNEIAAEQLLGSSEGAVGGTVQIDETEFIITGVLDVPEASAFAGRGSGDGPTPVVVVGSTAAAAMAETTHPSMIMLDASTDVVVADVVAKIEALLLERHDGLEDFTVISLEEIAASFEQITSVLTSFLAAIAAISLLVGGIGIMNIMLVVVSERTREIGIAKAIGATSRTVVIQFLVEAIVLSLIGGVLGMLLAWLGLSVVNGLIELNASISIGTLSLALGVSAGIGVLFGVAPAYRAARLDPIAALRHE